MIIIIYSNALYTGFIQYAFMYLFLYTMHGQHLLLYTMHCHALISLYNALARIYCFIQCVSTHLVLYNNNNNNNDR